MRKFFVWAIIIIALILALSGTFLPREKLTIVMRVTNFFDIMIPALGVGALINYLCKSCCCCRCRRNDQQQ